MCSARDLIMKLAFIPVVISKSLTNINFHFTFAEFHRLCVFLYCQDYAFVLKGKKLYCLSRRCFYKTYGAGYMVTEIIYWNLKKL